MNWREIILFVTFSIPLVASPGPVNIMLAGLGVQYGLRRNLKFLSGVTLAVIIATVACLLGLQAALQYPTTRLLLSIAGAMYFMYLAVKIYRLKISAPAATQTANSFYAGLLATMLNPKFYLMVAAIFAQFISPAKNNAASICIAFILILFCANFSWLLFGALLGYGARSARFLTAVNKIMGAALFAFAVYFFYDGVTA